MSTHLKKLSAAGMLITLGIIFGDIGTSPLYTFQTLMQEGGDASEGGGDAKLYIQTGSRMNDASMNDDDDSPF